MNDGSGEIEKDGDVAGPQAVTDELEQSADQTELLPELVAHLRNNRSELRQEWANRITDAHLLSAMTPHEVFTEATSVYDNYVEVLETGSVEELRSTPATSPSGSSRAGSRPTRSSASSCCCATCWPAPCSRSTSDDFDLLDRILDAYEPAANRIANTVAVSFVERARAGDPRAAGRAARAVDPRAAGPRAAAHPARSSESWTTREPTSSPTSCCGRSASHRARVVVIDITGVADVDEPVANHLVQTVDASRLMGAGVIITGLSSEIAQTLVTIGVDLSKMNTVGDLQGGIEEAERLLGFTVVRTGDAPR